jgi:hypothetical protein
MTDEMKAKREALKQRSAIAAKMVKAQPEKFSSVNDALVFMYNEEGHTEIHSFKKWMEKGYIVRKGEKALLLWGEPKKALKQEKQTDSNDKDEFKFFPLAYVFSQKQVEPMKHLAQ